MLHMNKQPRYQQIWRDLVTVYGVRGTESSHYIAGMSIGGQIASGLSSEELLRLTVLFAKARHAK